MPSTTRDPQPGSPLTNQEHAVLELASRGCTNAVIGERMHFSEDAVKARMRSILRKLDAQDRAHAVRRGFELGLLTPDRRGVTR